MDIRNKVVAECIKRLEAVGCLYHLIDHEGTEFGFPIQKPTVTEVVDEAKPRRQVDRKAGIERTKHVLPYLIQLEVGGDPVNVPLGEYSMADVQSTVGTRLLAAFGAGNYTTARNHEKKHVEVLLIGNHTAMGVPEALAASFGPANALNTWMEELLEHNRVAKRKNTA